MDNSINTNEKEVIQQLNTPDFATAVFKQLSKEFEKIGIALEFSEDELQDYTHFKNRLSSELNVIMREVPTRLSQLFYLTDMPEQRVNQLFETAEEPTQDIAALFLQRIAQKVILREKLKLGLL